MRFLAERLNIKRLSSNERKILLISVVIGLVLDLLCSGKPFLSLSFEDIAVSNDEQYIACFEPLHKIHCFRSDGSIAYTFDITPELSAGGKCTLWFDGDLLCVLFYRTDKIAYISSNGEVVDIVDNSSNDYSDEFHSFSKKGSKYVFNGNEVEVTYDKRNFLGYWLFGSERYLSVTPKGGETKIIYAWTAREGITKKIN